MAAWISSPRRRADDRDARVVDTDQTKPLEGIQPVAHRPDPVATPEQKGIPHDIGTMRQGGIAGGMALVKRPRPFAVNKTGDAHCGGAEGEVRVFRAIAAKGIVEATKPIECRGSYPESERDSEEPGLRGTDDA